MTSCCKVVGGGEGGGEGGMTSCRIVQEGRGEGRGDRGRERAPHWDLQAPVSSSMAFILALCHVTHVAFLLIKNCPIPHIHSSPAHRLSAPSEVR